MRTGWWKLGILITAVAVGSSVLYHRQTARSASVHASEQSAVLVELFTSEGCSSCPPADALLREWNGRVTASGRKVIGLSEHVTYWNQLGWSDPYSAETFTARQNGYGEHFQLDSVYTPQVVVNGRAQLVGSRRAGLVAALEAQPAYPLTLSLQSARRNGDHIDVAARISGRLPNPETDLFAAVTDDADQTEVKRGENAGETLRHAAVAREIVRIGRVSTDEASTSYTIPLPEPVRRDLQHGHHLVLFAQAHGFGEIYGADTCALE